MGERKGQNKYYPPDFDPAKHRSLAGYHGQHPLRERARKLDQGILIIRFEMPYNIWCGGCNNPIGMGVRYNAEKSKIGMYYSTPIYKFRMKCHLCTNHFEIKTDPANHDYVIIEGARRKEQRWDPKENEQIVPEDRESQKKLALDAMYKLEHGAEDKSKTKKAKPALALIEEHRSSWKDDYELNKIARKRFRGEKRALKSEAETDEALLKKASLDISLVKEHADDVKIAGLLKFKAVQTYDEKQKQKRQEISNRPLFTSVSKKSISSPMSATTCSSSSSESPLSLQDSKRKQLSNTRAQLGLAIGRKTSRRTPTKQEMVATEPTTVLQDTSSVNDPAANMVETCADSLGNDTDAIVKGEVVALTCHSVSASSATCVERLQDNQDKTSLGTVHKDDSEDEQNLTVSLNDRVDKEGKSDQSIIKSTNRESQVQEHSLTSSALGALVSNYDTGSSNDSLSSDDSTEGMPS